MHVMHLPLASFDHTFLPNPRPKSTLSNTKVVDPFSLYNFYFGQISSCYAKNLVLGAQKPNLFLPPKLVVPVLETGGTVCTPVSPAPAPIPATVPPAMPRISNHGEPLLSHACSYPWTKP